MKYSINSKSDFEKLHFNQARLSTPFSQQNTSFIDELSTSLLRDQELKQYPEIVSLGFWLRKGNINKLKSEFLISNSGQYALPRGLAFHVSPANVDTMFVYSWILSLLVGNTNIVRVPSSETSQINALIRIIASIVTNEKYKEIRESNYFIDYGHQTEINEYFSELCDVRVVWGGENTINEFRKIPIKDTAKEVSFTNKFSMTLVNAKSYIEYDQKEKLAELFYSDSYFMEQRACSSPKLVAWIGAAEIARDASQEFWMNLQKIVTSKKPNIDTSLIMDKFTDLTIFSMLRDAKQSFGEINHLNVIQLKELDDLSIQLNPGGGLFYEVLAKDMQSLFSNMNRSYQTVSVFGIKQSEIESIIETGGINGADRFVKMGKASDFDYVWDGFDLLKEFSRLISVDLS